MVEKELFVFTDTVHQSLPANLCDGDADEPVAEFALESREDVAQFRYHAPVHDRIL